MFELAGGWASRIFAQISTGAGCGVPVSVRQRTAIRAVQGNVSVLIVFFSAAKARIFQLKQIIIVPDSFFTLPYTSCHGNFFLAVVVVHSHVQGRSSAVLVTFIATFVLIIDSFLFCTPDLLRAVLDDCNQASTTAGVGDTRVAGVIKWSTNLIVSVVIETCPWFTVSNFTAGVISFKQDALFPRFACWWRGTFLRSTVYSLCISTSTLVAIGSPSVSRRFLFSQWTMTNWSWKRCCWTSYL